MIGEQWRPCPDFEEHYEVSSLGRVRSFARGAARILALKLDRTGYPLVNLNKSGKRHARTVHRLVCRAFHGEPFAPYREAAHINGDRTDARAENLKWVGKVQNHYHMRAHGTHLAGAKHPRAKLTEQEARDLLDLRGQVRASALGKRFGISANTVRAIWRGERWLHLTSIPFAGDDA